MEFFKRTFVGIIVLCSTGISMEKRSILKNEVTPVPTLAFTEFVDQMDIKNQQETDFGNHAKEAPVVVAASEDLVLTLHDKESRADIQPSYFPKNKSVSRTSSQPVCRYGMVEIFRLGVSQELREVDSKHLTTKFEETGKSGKTSDSDIHALELGYRKKLETENEITDTVVGEKSKADGHVNLEVSDMQSFEEWKNLKLQEKESRLFESESIPSHAVRAKKTQVNYASQDCGAKVLSHNKEAKHVSAILVENKDMYMLNPCSTNIWFIIELCEPIQVQQLQLGNLELFSSAPKEFSVSVSERYPAREWHLVGSFEATNERNLQTFAAKTEGQMFAKYVKFDMISHFANEHFCPLTLVRVLGVSMVDEFDEAEQMSPGKEGEIDSSESRHESSKGIAGDDPGADGPIHTVLNIVKTAIGLGNINNGATEVLEFTKANSREKGPDNSENERIDPSVESEIVLVTNENEVAASKRDKAQRFITLVETGKGEDLNRLLKNRTDYSSKRHPVTIPKFLHFLNPKLNVNICWFLEFFCKISIASCFVHYPYNYSAMGVFLPLANLAFQSAPFSADYSSRAKKSSGISDLQEEPIRVKKVSGAGSLIQTNGVDDPALVQTVVDEKSLVLPGQLQDSAQKEDFVDEDLVSSEIEPITNDEVHLFQSRSHSKSSHSGSDQADVSIGINGRVVRNGNENGNLRPDTLSHGHKAVVSSDLSINSADYASNNTENIGAEVAASENTTGTIVKPVANDTVPEVASDSQPSVVINPGTNQKDSVFMRLSNRIRVLEQNMSLSSDYLENLSQRFKKQMDEMQRAFDRTTSKLLTTGKTANDNDARQTELIQQAQAEIQLLKLQMQNLLLSNDRLSVELMERHVCFIILEIIVFTAVFVTCLGRRIAEVRSELCKSEEMTESLKRVIEDLKFGAPFKPNGHSETIPYNLNDQLQPVIPSDTVGSTSRRKFHMECLTQKKKKMKIENRVQNTSSNVEDIGNKLHISCVAMKGVKEKPHRWNGNTLTPQINSGHMRGRK